MKSTAQKIAQCEGLLGTRDLTAWENSFLQHLTTQSRLQDRPLSDRQLECLDNIWKKHFA